MLKFLFSLFNNPDPFQPSPKPKKYISKDEYVSLTPRQKKMLHSKYELYQKDINI